ncbi:TetR/AcrR family transcriptional regulator [Microbacterium resistens]|uniref:TetR/AcrR family transcriptional regulator n=1 Tax=Microbacterium resistens TaxID=156977 RepID=UPI001C586FBA|nr:TetR/AcrR family transcriptional regulator [Microbacterium resistens]MBW1640673.1 TetR/AcrR family transcriptional regulator [Microbacterium resistens]
MTRTPPVPTQESATARDRAKQSRRAALLHAASEQFARRGYAGVSLEDIGSAAGVSGPAVYRHFAGKQALLGAVLVEVSEDLVAGGRAVASSGDAPAERMDALIRFHVDFALSHPDVIRVQDRDVTHLGDEDLRRVRRLQRAYIDLWQETLAALVDAGADQLRLRVQACFGLINSTPHSTRAAERGSAETAHVLRAMATAALLAPSR